MLGGGPVNALGFERLPVDGFGMPFFLQGAVAARLPHFPDALDFQRAGLSIIKAADFMGGEISFSVHGTGRHENVTVSVPAVAFHVGMVEIHTNGAPVGVAKLKAETAQ